MNCMPCYVASRDGEISEANALRRLEPARPWVWTAIDPVSKLLLAIEVGPRTVAMAQRVVHHVVGVLAPGCLPAWFSDGCKGSMPAIGGHCGRWVHPERRQGKGPWPKPRWMPRMAAPAVGMSAATAPLTMVIAADNYVRGEGFIDAMLEPFDDPTVGAAWPQLAAGGMHLDAGAVLVIAAGIGRKGHRGAAHELGQHLCHVLRVMGGDRQVMDHGVSSLSDGYRPSSLSPG